MTDLIKEIEVNSTNIIAKIEEQSIDIYSQVKSFIKELELVKVTQ